MRKMFTVSVPSDCRKINNWNWTKGSESVWVIDNYNNKHKFNFILDEVEDKNYKTLFVDESCGFTHYLCTLVERG